MVMISASVILNSLLILIVLYLMVRVGKLRRILTTLNQDQRVLSEAWRVEQQDLSQFLGARRRPVITIEILNAVELAAGGSVFGRILGRYAPDMIRTQVYKRTAANMRDNMTEHGVKVVVEVHGCD